MKEQLPILDLAGDEGLHRDSDVPLGDEIVDDRRTAGGRPMREAAVLVPLVREAGEWHILFIRRAANERDRHSGQVAFPGGAREASDASAGATALREAREEIGLTAERVELLGVLGPYVTVSNYRVTPVVGVVEWPTPLRLQAEEVARTFLIPLAWLRRRENLTLRARHEMDPASARRHPIIVFEPYDGETLWGATARMTVNFIKAIDDGLFVLPAGGSGGTAGSGGTSGTSGTSGTGGTGDMGGTGGTGG